MFSSGYERGIRIYDTTETWVFSLNEHTPYFSSRVIFSWIVPCEVIKIITGCIFPPDCVIRKYLGKFPFERYFSQRLVPLSIFQVTNRWDIDKTCRLSLPVTHLCQGRERKITEWRKPELTQIIVNYFPSRYNRDNPFQLRFIHICAYVVSRNKNCSLVLGCWVMFLQHLFSHATANTVKHEIQILL